MMLAALGNSNGKGTSQLLFYVLGIAIAILFAAVGLVVTDIRQQISDNQRTVSELHRMIIHLQAALHEETRLTQQYREWFEPRLVKMEQDVLRLKWPGTPPMPPEK